MGFFPYTYSRNDDGSKCRLIFNLIKLKKTFLGNVTGFYYAENIGCSSVNTGFYSAIKEIGNI